MRILIAALLMALPWVCHADEIVRQISVTGQASESLMPDTFSLSVTVSARNNSLNEAKKEHDAKLRTLLEVAERYGIKGKYLSTGRAGIHPQWQWDNNKQVFKGYVVQTTLSMHSQSLDRVGQLIEAVVAVQPERMQGPNFYLEDARPVENALRLAALQDAKVKAEALAKEAGLKLGKPISISDSWQMPQPLVMRSEMAMMARAADSDPVAPPQGEQEVVATVNVVYEMIP